MGNNGDSYWPTPRQCNESLAVAKIRPDGNIILTSVWITLFMGDMDKGAWNLVRFYDSLTYF
jgi:hypothetical protein